MLLVPPKPLLALLKDDLPKNVELVLNSSSLCHLQQMTQLCIEFLPACPVAGLWPHDFDPLLLVLWAVLL